MGDSGAVTCDDKTSSPTQRSEIDPVGLLSDNWDASAQEWINWVRAPDCPDSYYRFHRDQFLPLVPDPGKLTVDIGCGEGRVGRDLRKLGHKVLGVDLSPRMCRAAATHPDGPSPTARADAARLPLADMKADCAVAFMSLQDIDDMPGAVREIARVLKDGCPLVLAIVHPMYSGGGFSGASLNSESPFVIKRSYFQTERLVSTDVHEELTVTFFREHRPLQAYTRALTEAGFIIDALHELTDEDQDRHRDGIPMFIDIVATRRPREESFRPGYRRKPRRPAAVRPPARERSKRRPSAWVSLDWLSSARAILPDSAAKLLASIRFWRLSQL